jgi:ssDNA-binding Zn-finger/Zn-ribbon topoisomerase 1
MQQERRKKVRMEEKEKGELDTENIDMQICQTCQTTLDIFYSFEYY